MVKTDPWAIAREETVKVGGIEVTVRGLMVDEIEEITKAHEKDMRALGKALICACCTRKDGVPITPAMLGKIRPDVLRELDTAVAKANGVSKGNSNATDGEDSSSG